MNGKTTWLPALLATLLLGCTALPGKQDIIMVNDLHSRLNPTVIDRIEHPTSIAELQTLIKRAARKGEKISISGGRHAMGGQQFGTGTVLLDMRSMNKIISLDKRNGIIEVEAGIQWPELVDYLVKEDKDQGTGWSIIQKQTGADRFSLGGSLSANIHGRGLTMRPMVDDIESFLLVDADGALRRCNRTENTELFKAVIGGYGLFGVVATVQLRLQKRHKLERQVALHAVEELAGLFRQRIAEGFTYGDFQFSTDETSDHFLQNGIFSCYKPVDAQTPLSKEKRKLSRADWRNLYFLSFADRGRAYATYTQHYLATSGQVYWSDLHQMSTYFDDYHEDLEKRLPPHQMGTLMITELYVPLDQLADFMRTVRKDVLADQSKVIYGTIRLIREDRETRMPWARADYACVIFNLLVQQSEEGIQTAKQAFRKMIDRAIERNGSFYLTYHRWATQEQLDACYPQFTDILRLKREVDPNELFQSSWYNYYKGLFLERLYSFNMP